MLKNNLPRTIVFEGSAGGHRAEFIEYLFLFLHDVPKLKDDYLFLLNEDLRKDVEEQSQAVGGLNIKGISMEGGPDELIARAYWEWKKIEKILAAYPSINRILFMNLDGYQYLILSPVFTKYKLEVNGILFQPYHHLPFNSLLKSDNVKLGLRKLRKYLTSWCLINLNKKVNKIFILNDEDGVRKLNSTFLKRKKDIFSYLPDPIDTRNLLRKEENSSTRLKLKIPSGKNILLLFGGIDERKNLYNIIEALSRLPVSVQSEISLIIAGKFVTDQAERMKSFLISSIEKYPALQIIFNDEIVPKNEMEHLFKGCDLVLMPYINFYSSSGVIGHAAKYHKKVVASSLGIAKRIVEKYSMGIAVNPTNPDEIKSAIVSLLNKKGNDMNTERFVKDHHYLTFAKVLLSHDF